MNTVSQIHFSYLNKCFFVCVCVFFSTNDKSSIELWETGLPPLWTKNSLPPAPICFAKAKSNTSNKVPIRLNDLTGPFLVLGIGLSLSIFLFLMEIIFFNFRKLMTGKNILPVPTTSQQSANDKMVVYQIINQWTNWITGQKLKIKKIPANSEASSYANSVRPFRPLSFIH